MVDGPLNGVRILDLTHVWAGPLAVRFLADLGADVVKVESPLGRGPRVPPASPLGGWIGGEPGAEPWNANALFVKLARNRQSLCIDLKTEPGRDTFLELVAEVDVVLENFSARAMPAFGLSWDVLKVANPNLVYVTMPGYGASGPYKDRVAFGPSVEPLSGLTNVLGYGPDEPRNTAIALMDPITGLNATAALVSALRERERLGHGVLVEMSLHEGGVTYSGPWLVDEQLGNTVQSMGNAHPAMSPHGVYRALGDDEWLAVACATDAQWCSLHRVLEEVDSNGELNSDWSLAERTAHCALIDALLAQWTGVRNKQIAEAQLLEAGVPAGAVNNAQEMVTDAQTRDREFFVPYERFATPMPGNPIKMAGLDSSQWTACPRLGADNARVLKSWLGYDDQQVQALVDAGVLADKPPQ